MYDLILYYSNIISYITINNLDISIFLYDFLIQNLFLESRQIENNIFIGYYLFCFSLLIIIPFLQKKPQDVFGILLLILLFGDYFGIIVLLLVFDIILYYGAQFISKKINIRPKEIKNISGFQYFAKLFPFIGFLSFFRIGLSNKLEIKKILKMSFISNCYSFFCILFTFFIVFGIGETLNTIYNTREYEVLIVWWQFLIIGIYAMIMYHVIGKKQEESKTEEK